MHSYVVGVASRDGSHEPRDQAVREVQADEGAVPPWGEFPVSVEVPPEIEKGQNAVLGYVVEVVQADWCRV